MSQEVINKVTKQFMKNVPEIQVGDTIVVDTIIRDGEKKRSQKFEGIVIAINGAGISKSITVRKISYGVGVEKIFPIHSTNIDSIKVLKHAKVRRSKLYYLRGRIGKAATYLKKGKPVVHSEGKVEEVVPMPAEEVATEEVVASSEETAKNE